MKITLTTIDLPEELWKEFAQKFCGWRSTIMTETESPNYEIENPITFQEAIKAKYYTPIVTDVAQFNLSEAEELAKQKIDEANAELENAKQEAQTNAESVVLFIAE